MVNVATPQAGLPDELAAILASTHDAIIGLTPQGVITSWNRAAAELYGYSAEEIIGQNSTVLVALDRRDEEAEILRRIVRGESVGEYRTARVSKDGSVVAVSLTSSAIIDATNAPVDVVMVSRRLAEPPDSQPLERRPPPAPARAS
jgi:PAS domain S-box-containing protein